MKTLLPRLALAPLTPVVLGLAAGCMVGPDYHAPSAPLTLQSWTTPAVTPAAPGIALDSSATPADAWWQSFHDPLLNRLVGRALVASPDLTIAAARLREARAGLAFANGGRLPRVGLGASKREFRRTGPLNTLYRGAYPTFQAGFDASWELDLWGSTRRTVAAAGALAESAAADERGARLALAAEVARAYVDLRSTQRRAALAAANLARQRRTLELTRERLRAGLAGELDVLRAAGLVSTTEALLPQLQDGTDHLVRLVSLLLGEEPNTLAPELAPVAPIPAPPSQVAVGLPAELLRQRPDVAAAERRLAAATARIGATQAQLYPRLTLVGTIGLVSTTSQDLFEYSNRYFSVGPGLHWNLFDAGRVRAEVEAATARSARAYAEYRKTVLAALADVENALGSLDAEQRRHVSLGAAEDAARRAVATASELYRSGLTDFLSVLDAERALATAEDSVAQSDRAVATQVIALYKALGGGPATRAAPAIALTPTRFSPAAPICRAD